MISDEELTIANGMLTPSLELERQSVLATFGSMLEALYRQPEVTPSLVVQQSAPASATQTRH